MQSLDRIAARARGNLHKKEGESLCNMTVDKTAEMWYNMYVRLRETHLQPS